MIFESLNESNERGELLVEHGLCHFHLRRDGQLTIREIIVERDKGVGRRMLALLRERGRARGATSIFAKCPVELAANGWYKKMGFECAGRETTRSGRALNLWRLTLGSETPGDNDKTY